jgi:hypothetical protein
MKYPTVYVDALFKRIESLSYFHHPYEKSINNMIEILEEIQRVVREERENENEDFGIAGK